MAWNPTLDVSPALSLMLKAEEERALRRGDGYLGTEHMLEALIEDSDGIAVQILRQLGVAEQVGEALDRYWSSPGTGSLLMTDCSPDPDGEPYQVLLGFDRPGAPSRLLLDDVGRVQVIRRASEPDDRVEPAPAEVAERALRWAAEQRDDLQT